MSRGRKPKGKVQDSDWGTIFNKNIGYYFQTILTELGTNFKIKTDKTDSGQFLLEQIRTKIKSKSYTNIEDNEIPFKIPEHWVWCRLGEISINRDGERKPISQVERGGRDKIYDYYGASGIIDKIDGFTHEGEYLLIGEDGANLVSRSTPIAFIVNGRFWVNNHAHVIETLDRETLEFLCYFFNAIDLKPFITGGFQPKLSQGSLNRIPIPLPPLSEQQNIVTFINDMKSANLKKEGFYFDREVEQKIVKLHNAQLIGSNITFELTHQLQLVQKLRQQLLQEAVQGDPS
jgi:restriction endonuclease S subunit